MPKKVRFQTSDSVLFMRTRKLLKNRPHCLTYAEIAEKSGVPEEWIKSFGQGRTRNPSVIRVEKLYNALSSAPLELPDEL